MSFADKLFGEHCGWCRKALGVESDHDSPTGAKLALAAFGVFLIPLLLALVGAIVFSTWDAAGGVVGGLGGFAVGLLAAIGLRRWGRRSVDRHGGESPDRSDEVQR